MKKFRWITLSISILFLSVQAVEASDDAQEPDPNKLALLQIPVSEIQTFLMEDSLIASKQTSGSQYLALERARSYNGCLYFFSLYAEPEGYKPENHTVYREILGDIKHWKKIISPIVMRVLGAYGHKEKDYYQGTYEIRQEGFLPFRFHALAIEMRKVQELKNSIAFYILNTMSKKDSAQLSTLCKEEYELTLDGKRAQDDQKRWISLEKLIGEKISITKPKKRKVFTRKNKESDVSQEKEPGHCSSQEKRARSASVSVMSKNSTVASSSEQEKKDTPPPVGQRRKGNLTLLGEETEALLEDVRKSQTKIKENPSESSSSSSTSTQDASSMPNVPITASASQAATIVKSEAGTTSVSRRQRNRALTRSSAEDLAKKK